MLPHDNSLRSSKPPWSIPKKLSLQHPTTSCQVDGAWKCVKAPTPFPGPNRPWWSCGFQIPDPWKHVAFLHGLCSVAHIASLICTPTTIDAAALRLSRKTWKFIRHSLLRFCRVGGQFARILISGKFSQFSECTGYFPSALSLALIIDTVTHCLQKFQYHASIHICIPNFCTLTASQVLIFHNSTMSVLDCGFTVVVAGAPLQVPTSISSCVSHSIFPESACGGFFVKKLPLFTSSHPHICWSTSSHLHTCWFTSSRSHICWSTSSHLHICWSTSSHPHICWSTSSHPHTCWSTSSHPHICWSTSSHPHTCWSTSSHSHICWSTSSHLHICWSTPSHLHVCWSTSSHPHICWSTSSHPHTCWSTSSHLHICWSTSSHPHTCWSTSSDPHICWSTLHYIFTPSHLLIYIFTPSHLQIHLQIDTFTPSHLVALFFLSLSIKAGAVPPEGHETQPFRTKWTLDVKNWGRIAILVGPSQPFRTKWTLDVENWGRIAILLGPSQPFRTKWTLDVKNWSKIAILRCPVSLATLTSEMEVRRQKLKKNYDFTWPIATVSHEMDVGRQKLRENCDFTGPVSVCESVCM